VSEGTAYVRTDPESAGGTVKAQAIYEVALLVCSEDLRDIQCLHHLIPHHIHLIEKGAPTDPWSTSHTVGLLAAIATHKKLPSLARAPAWLTTLSVLSRCPVVVVKKMSAVWLDGWEYQRL
jgi:hypothetical protein